jgi:hypothetical protein
MSCLPAIRGFGFESGRAVINLTRSIVTDAVEKVFLGG